MRSTFKVLFYLKRNKEKPQPVVPVMGRITVYGTIAQFSTEQLWEVRGGRAKGRSIEADRISRHLDNIRTQIEARYRGICDWETYVTAEKIKNAWQGFGQRYKTLPDAFQHFRKAEINDKPALLPSTAPTAIRCNKACIATESGPALQRMPIAERYVLERKD